MLKKDILNFINFLSVVIESGLSNIWNYDRIILLRVGIYGNKKTICRRNLFSKIVLAFLFGIDFWCLL